MHAVAIKANALVVQMQQLIQPLYLLIVILQGLSFNFIFFADNNYDHYHHRGDSGGNMLQQLGQFHFWMYRRPSVLLQLTYLLQCLQSIPNLKLLLLTLLLKLLLSRNQYNSSTCYYSSSINQCTSIVNYWSMQIIDTSDIVYTLGCMLRMQKENLSSMLSMLSIHEEYCNCYLLIMHESYKHV